MPEVPVENGDILGPLANKQYLYTVLNLPTTATDYEIRDRYRQLSVLFHPDKQQDERTKETATKRFLEVQHAYQVLSDPVSRQAYDLLGLDGLVLLSHTEHQGLTTDELKEDLLHKKCILDQERMNSILRSSARVTVGVDASSLFADYEGSNEQPWYQNLSGRYADVQQTAFNMQHTIEKHVTKNTAVTLTGRSSGRVLGVERSALAGDIMGTIRHQFSPRFSFQASTSILSARPVKLKAIYSDENSTATIQTYFSPFLVRQFALAHSQATQGGVVLLPPVTLVFTRRLFPASSAQGVFTLSTISTLPVLSLSISSAYPFDHTPEAVLPTPVDASDRPLRPPSRSGLATGEWYWRVGVILTGVLPGINGECGINFLEISVRLRSMLQVGMIGSSCSVGAVWTGERKSASADVELGEGGVALKLEFYYLNQHLHLPVILSHEYDTTLAFWTTLVPTSALVLAYHFVFRPLNRKRRMEYFRTARRELREAKSDLLRENEETISLLQETAKRHMQAEASEDGLMILEAWYGPAERSEDTEGLEINVTIPIQALVNKSQLYIPGRRSKAGLQGFYDPVPAAAKSLRIRYTFRGREHYAEVPDFMPVVLPLEDHLVK